MTRHKLILALITAGLVLAATSAAFNLTPSRWFSDDSAVVAQTQGTPTASPAPQPALTSSIPAGIAPNYRAIVQQVGPAVVGVNVVGPNRALPDELPLDLNDPFFRFFRGLPGFQWRLPGQGEGMPSRSQGSGFIISSDGLILTNAHVVREAKEVSIKLSDRREFKAQVLGADTATDIAVLRVTAKNLPVVRLGDSRQLQVGDPVLAIGSPFGFEQTATQGIVSALGRSLPGDTSVPFIQTDAAVNPGNSGGPLFDGSGAVVGINAQIYSQSGGYQGLSFAIPIHVALKVKDQIVATGHAAHARLGVMVQDMNQALAESFGLSRPDGALVADVAPDSAAAAAGLLPGDVITAANDQPITRSGDLSSHISLAVPGDTVRLKFWRGKQQQAVSVKLGRAQDDTSTVTAKAVQTQPGQLGLSLRPLTREEQASARLQGGLLVQGATGAAARANLLPGDVLLAINGVPLKSVDQLRSVIEQRPKVVAFLVLRGGARIYAPVELG